MHSKTNDLVSVFLPLRKGSKRIKNKNIKPLPRFKQGLTELKLNQLQKFKNIFLKKFKKAKIEFIISTNCPTGPREILINGRGGELVKIGDYKSISRSIYAYSKNKKKLNKKITNSYISLKRFDMQENLKKYLKVILNYTKIK